MDIKDYANFIQENIESLRILMMDFESEASGYQAFRDILIDTKDDENEQVKSVIHEFLHTHPEFEGKSGIGHKRDQDIEDQIENITQQIYKSCPDTTGLVRNKLILAKSNVFHYL